MNIEATSIPHEFDRYSHLAIDLLDAAQSIPLPYYPAHADRWHISPEEWDAMTAAGVITIPDGPWEVKNHPARERAAKGGEILDPADPSEISVAQKAIWRDTYELVTDQGLPVHPAARLGVTSIVWDGLTKRCLTLGMATGIARERRYGATKTGALLLARLNEHDELEYPVVTEERGGKMRRNFPGGYAEIGETVMQAIVRETGEESDLIQACKKAGVPWQLVERLPSHLWELTPSIVGPCTVNAWLAENFWAIDATSVSDMRGVRLRANESAIKNVAWLPPHVILADNTFLSTHKRALRAHMWQMKQDQNQ